MPKPLFIKAPPASLNARRDGRRASIASAFGLNGAPFATRAALPATRLRHVASRFLGALICVWGLSLAGTAAAQIKGGPAQGGPAQGSTAQGGLPAQAPAGASEPDPLALTLKRARDLRTAKKWDDALIIVDKGLTNAPRDLQLRFLKGLILTDQSKPDAAIPVFEGLTQDYPELGEPYNNLAVLLAGKGELDRARGLLERAIQAQPNYALAYENLGDVHLRLAERAYQDAVGKNPALKSAKVKLDQARQWVKSTESKP